MFLEIPPSQHVQHEIFLNPIVEWFKNKPLLQDIFKTLKKGTFLVFCENENKPLGGAFLLRQSFTSVYPRVQADIRKILSPNSVFWTGTVFLCEEDNGFSKQYEFMCEIFYRNLYQKLVEFGQRELIQYLYMILEPGEYLCTEVIGAWPYVRQMKLDDSFKGLSHHILSLTKAFPGESLYHENTKVAELLNLAACVSQVSSRQTGEGSPCFY